MAERIVSPGVFTQERDQSFLAQGVAQIGAAFVGPMAKGPAFIPTSVQGIDGFVTTFGEPDGTSYAGYTVKNYLQEAGTATVVRVLGWTKDGSKGYTTNVANVYVSGSGGRYLFATLHPNITVDGLTGIVATGNTGSFSLAVTGSGSAPDLFIPSISFSETSATFITNVFGTSPITPSATGNPAYVYAVFPGALTSAGTGSAVVVSASIHSLAMTSNYSNATTPWIKSQDIGGLKYNLFKLHSLNDGVVANKDFKITISGISPSTDPDSDYGTFTLSITDFNESFSTTMESWSNLTLDPSSPDYIARRIGNSEPTYNTSTGETYYEGDYVNNSKYVRVEMSDDVVPANAVPYGFARLTSVTNLAVATGSAPTYVTTRIVNGEVRDYFYGYDFSVTDNLSYLAPTYGSDTVGSEFNISNITTNEVDGLTPINLDTRSHVSYRKFAVPMQGGFDGFSPSRVVNLGADISATNTQGFNLSSVAQSGSVAFKRGLDSLSNPDSVDLNLLVLPGVIHQYHSYVTQAAINLCESRGDCFYVMDIAGLGATIDEVTTLSEALDTNYAAAYYPWVRVLDTNTNKLIWAPPSVVLPEVYAYSDNNGAEWFAPAGLNRGGVPGAVGVKTRLSQSQRDELYESKVNPIAQFPEQGISVWGQKTLQRRASALDRINVRRLLITVKKYIASSARYLVFEQNTEATRNRFLNIVNPYLAGIQQRSGLTSFRVVMDETNNTPDIIDRNILVGSIYLQPTRTAEFIKLDFNILPTGASFDTI